LDAENQERAMQAQIFNGHENCLTAITAIAVEANALVYDIATEEIRSTDDPVANRKVFAAVFQAWADGRIGGTAEQIFEAVFEVLED
jgi:hypothetical protein